jgi:hypothetical protein
MDDMLITAKSMLEIRRLKSQLCSGFEKKDLGVVKKIIGMDIYMDGPDGKARKLYLSHKKYIVKLFGTLGYVEF